MENEKQKDHGIQFKQEARERQEAPDFHGNQYTGAIRQTFAEEQKTDADDRKTDARIGEMAGVSRETDNLLGLLAAIFLCFLPFLLPLIAALTLPRQKNEGGK